MSSVVYFAQEGSDGAIKIGWSSRIDRRLSNLSTGNSRSLSLLHSIPGGVSLEIHIHELLSADRIRGEWFNPSPAVLNLIEKVRSGGSAVFGAGFAEAPDLSLLFARDRQDGCAEDIARMFDLSNSIADAAIKAHGQKERTSAVARCLGVSWNRANEFLRSKARKIEHWEMCRAEDALTILSRVGALDSAVGNPGEAR